MLVVVDVEGEGEEQQGWEVEVETSPAFPSLEECILW